MVDEPFIGLMPKFIPQVFEAISSPKEKGLAILLVEQNVREALELANRDFSSGMLGRCKRPAKNRVDPILDSYLLVEADATNIAL
jgi:branched-chain amino acid transport system ATP-binding protein